MSVIKVRCTDQVLAYENTPVIASGGLDENFIAFSFCSQWDGFDRTAVFWRSEDEAYHCLLDESDTCQVPPEVTMEDGIIWLGAFGVDVTGRQRTSEVLSYRIVKGAITVNTKPSDPTPDIYTQILAEMIQVRELAEATKAAEEAFEQAMTRQQSAFETSMGNAHAEHVKAVSDQQAQHVADVEDARLAYEQSIQDQIAAGLVPDGSVTTPKLAGQAVTMEKLAHGAVGAPNILSGAVTADKLAGDVYDMFKDVVNLHVWEIQSDDNTYYVSSYSRSKYTEGEGVDIEPVYQYGSTLTGRFAVSKLGASVKMRVCYNGDLLISADGTVTMNAYTQKDVTEANLLQAQNLQWQSIRSRILSLPRIQPLFHSTMLKKRQRAQPQRVLSLRQLREEIRLHSRECQSRRQAVSEITSVQAL